MSDIATKLTYLDTTREKIKESINITGVGITEQDTFRSYEHKLKQGLVDIINKGTDEVYENFPKVSGSGSDISLENTYESKMKIDMGGDTEQESTSGKNLFDKNNSSQILNAYINSSTNKIASNSNARTLYINCNPNTTYTISRIAGQRFIVGDTTELPTNNLVMNGIITNHTASNITITTEENSNYLCVFYYLSSADTLTEEEIRNSIMINEGSTALPYEPYTGGQPSPSPDYPQEIKTVTGRQEIGVIGKNLYSGDDTLENQYTYIIPSKAGKTYTLSFKGQTTQRSRVFLRTYKDLEHTTFVDNVVAYVEATLDNYSLTLTSTINGYLFIALASSASIYTFQNIMLNEGSTASEYEPYKSQSYEVDLDDIELCKIGDYKNSIKKSAGKNLANVTLTHDYISAVGLISTGDNKYLGVSNNIPVKPNTQYTISFSNYTVGSLLYGAFDNTGTFIERISIGGTYRTFTTGNNVYFIRPYFYNSTEIYDDLTGGCQLEEGTTATSYEPYGTGWYIEKQIGKVVLDGSESNWVKSSSNYRFYLTLIGALTPSANTNIANILSNYFTPTSATYSYQNQNTNGIALDTSSVLYIRYADYNNQTLADFKTWLSSNNVIVYYALDTPTYETITQQNYPTLYEDLNNLENAISYNEKTYISVQGNLPSLLEVVALGDN